ncbi:MAG: hypothetical protein WC843_00970 [Candidatus Gracilibacteria bacterium]
MARKAVLTSIAWHTPSTKQNMAFLQQNGKITNEKAAVKKKTIKKLSNF